MRRNERLGTKAQAHREEIMRSGCSLPATVLLLLFSGLAVWGARHWKPSIICDNSSLSWFCGGYANVAGGLSGLGGGNKKDGHGSDSPRGSGKKVANAMPWPVAEKSRSWSNFREGAYSMPAVRAPAKVEAKSNGSALPWPIADAPRKWSNYRDGAYSVPAKRKTEKVKSKTVAHPFAWPIADAPRKWSNYRDGAYSVPAKPKAVKAESKTVAHPFPWPIAKAPRTWTNFRKAPKPKKIVAKKPPVAKVVHVSPGVPYASNYISHGVSPARNALQLLVLRVKKKPPAPPAPIVSPTVPYADNYSSLGPHPARNGLELLILRVKKGAMKKASDCGAELNQVASDGVILFETASAKLKDSSYDTLDRLAGVAKTCDRVNIVVEGHTDDRGSASFNQSLSEQRAQSVAAYLQGAGVAAGSLSAVGYGESRPAVPNTTRANLAKNRRIEFSVSGN